jgi:hypothetical protein
MNNYDNIHVGAAILTDITQSEYTYTIYIIYLLLILEIGRGGVDWIGLAQDRDKWRAVVNAVMNLRVP